MGQTSLQGNKSVPRPRMDEVVNKQPPNVLASKWTIDYVTFCGCYGKVLQLLTFALGLLTWPPAK